MKIMYFYSTSKEHSRKKKFFVILFMVAIAFMLFIWIIGMRNIINKYALNKLEYMVTSIIDESVYETFKTHNIDTNSLLNISKNNGGEITGISIEPYYANLLKAEISSKIVERVNNISNDDLEITLGMLVGHFGLGSWGPKLPLTVSPNGNVNIDFSNNFESCGINQIKDNISIDVNVDVSAMMPFYSFNSNIHSTVLLAQTVIIGDVPNTYINTGENNNDR